MENERKIIRLEKTESTNSVALELGEQGAVAGTVVVAQTQTSGRGRLKRHWLSPPGMGLYFSIILQPDLAPEHLPKVTLAAGLALCKAVEAEYSLAPEIKWPNDLLLDGRKFGGILTETGFLQGMAKGRKPFVVIGAGVNLFTPGGGFQNDLKECATSIADHTDRTISAEPLLMAGVSAIEQEVQRLEKGDFQEILEEWMERDGVKDKVLTWVTPQGKKVTGVSLGPDADGVLRIRDGAGVMHEVLSGDVNLVGKGPE